MRLFGKDWRKVEAFIQTRSGVQIRSHAQKYFISMAKLDFNTKHLTQEHKRKGFTERSLNKLLNKICTLEKDIATNENEVIPIPHLAMPKFEPRPLIKTMMVKKSWKTYF